MRWKKMNRNRNKTRQWIDTVMRYARCSCKEARKQIRRWYAINRIIPDDDIPF